MNNHRDYDEQKELWVRRVITTVYSKTVQCTANVISETTWIYGNISYVYPESTVNRVCETSHTYRYSGLGRSGSWRSGYSGSGYGGDGYGYAETTSLRGKQGYFEATVVGNAAAGIMASSAQIGGPTETESLVTTARSASEAAPVTAAATMPPTSRTNGT